MRNLKPKPPKAHPKQSANKAQPLTECERQLLDLADKAIEKGISKVHYQPSQKGNAGVPLSE
jgi:hypothetical protein